MTEPAHVLNPPTSTPSRFRAFISYSHADKGFARKLHRHMETYRLPASLMSSGEDAGLGRIYLDREELGAAQDLPAAVERALADSESLIVVVSRSSLNSRWVQAEVKAFRSLRPKGSILCIYAPKHSGLPLGSLLDAVSEAEEPLIDMPRLPLVVNVDDLGFEDASLALISALFGRNFDELRNREGQRRRRRRRILIAIMVAVAAVVIVLGVLSLVAAIKSNRERNNALAGQSELLAAQAMDAIRAGNATLATRLALAALPSAKLDRPYAWQAAVALSRSAQHLRSVSQVDHSGEALALLAPSATQPGRRLAVSQSGKLHLDGPGDTRETLQLKSEKGDIRSALYVKQHALVLALTGKQLIVWNETTQIQSIQPMAGEPSCMTLAPDGSALTVTLSTQVEILRLPDLTSMHQVVLPPGLVGECAVFSPSRKTAVIASMTAEGRHLLDTVNVVNLDRAPLATLKDMAFNMAIAPDDSVAAVAVADDSVLVWKLDGVPQLRRLVSTETPSLAIPVSLGFVDGGRQLLIGDNVGAVHFFDVDSQRRTDVFAEHTGTILSLIVDPIDRVVHSSDDRGFGKSWPIAPLLYRRALSGNASDAGDSIVSRSGNRLVTSLYDGQVVEWDTSSLDKPLAVTKPCGRSLRAVAVSHEGLALAAGCDSGEIFRWKGGTTEPALVHRAGGSVDDLQFGAGGQLRFAARSGRFGEIRVDDQVIEASSGESTHRIAEIPRTAQVLVVDQLGRGIVHDLNANREIRRLAGPLATHGGNQNSLGGVVTDSGRYVAIGGADDRIRFWDLTDGRKIAEASFGRGSRDALVAGPDDQVAYIENGVVHVWSPALRAPRPLPSALSASAVAFVPGRPRHLVTAAGQESVRFWDLDSEYPYAQVVLNPRRADRGIARDVFFAGKNGELVGVTARQGPVLGATPPPTSSLVSTVKRYAPLVAGDLSKEDMRRFALPMESILRQHSTPVFGISLLDDITEKTLRLIGQLDLSLQSESSAPLARTQP